MPQWSRRRILAVWAAAALPMAVIAWVVAPWWAAGDGFALSKALVAGLAAGLVWQSLLVLGLVWHERGSLRPAVVADALWLRPPADRGAWLVVAVFAVPFLLAPAPDLPHSPHRDFAAFLQSDAGQAFFHGNWAWYGLVAVLLVANTVTGEELLFRGLLLPRMAGAFGQADWLVNGVLFAAYHLHTPWVIPGALLDALWLAWPSRRWRSAWPGIVVHSTASVLVMGLLWPVVAGA